jgi:hypothetical protein
MVVNVFLHPSSSPLGKLESVAVQLVDSPYSHPAIICLRGRSMDRVNRVWPTAVLRMSRS